MTLLNEMMSCLPIYAYPTRELLNHTNTKSRLTLKSKLEITSVMDSGHAGGIMCGIALGQEVLLVSLTHLEFRDEHPLRDRINAYKQDRIRMLRAETTVRSNLVGRNDPCPCGSGKKHKRCCGV